MSHIKITCPDGKGHNTKIELNGHPLERCSSVEFSVDHESRAWVRLMLVPDSVEIVGDALVYAGVSLPFADRDQ